MTHETHLNIDLEALLAENPDSDTLRYLLSPEYQEERDSRRYVGPSESDWGHRLQRETQVDEPTISVAAAVAVYLNQMRPVRAGFEQQALDQTKQLHLGQKVVQLTRDSGFGHGERVNFDSFVNGILVAEPRIISGYNDPYKYSLALHFADQARPIEASISAEIAVGNDQISELHANSLGEKKHMWAESGTALFQQRLKNSAIMQKLGLLEGTVEFENERDEVVAAASALTDPNTSRPTDLKWAVGLLPDLHLLDPELADRRITEIAGSDRMYIIRSDFADTFVEAVAQVRASKALFSLGKFAADAARARAQAEIYEIAAEKEEAPAITKENA